MAEGFGKELDRDTAAELRVGGLIHVSHATRPDVTRDLVMCESASDHVRTKILDADFIKQPHKSFGWLKTVVKIERRRLTYRDAA